MQFASKQFLFETFDCFQNYANNTLVFFFQYPAW